MIFSEIYSAYYNAVASIITAVLDGEHNERKLQDIVSERAFGESVLTILPSLKSGKWQIVRSDFTTPIRHEPTMPLTTIQKRWLKSISLDPRIKLFDINFPALDDVQPLFTPNDYYVYDKYSDGDPFDDDNYIKNFRTILTAIKNETCLSMEIENRSGRTTKTKCKPLRLEYSEKDDKFRLIGQGANNQTTNNLAKIRSCSICNNFVPKNTCNQNSQQCEIVVQLTDERNTLERFMLHFAHFEKQAEKLDGDHYSIKIKYATNDESEIVIRILSFGPMVEVVKPDSFRNLIIDKLKKQISCGL